MISVNLTLVLIYVLVTNNQRLTNYKLLKYEPLPRKIPNVYMQQEVLKIYFVLTISDIKLSDIF